MPKKVLSIEVTGKDAGAKKTIDDLGLSADQSARKVKELNAATARSGGGKDGGTIKSLKAAFGEESTFGNIGKIAVGTGAIAGFTLIGRALKDAATNAVELKNEFNAGRLSAGQLTEKLVEGLPVVGQFWSAGRAIKELITGEAAEVAKITEQTKLQNDYLDYQAKNLKQNKKIHEEIADIQRGANQRAGRIGLEGLDAARYDAQTGMQNRLVDINKKREADRDAAKQSADDATKAIREQRDKGQLKPEEYRAAEAKIAKARDAELAQIDKEFAAARKAESIASVKEIEQVENNARRDSLKLNEQYDRDIEKINTDAKVARLKALGQDFAAELVLLDAQAEEKKQAIAKNLEEQMKTVSPILRDQIKAQADAEAQAVDEANSANKAAAAKKHSDDLKQSLKQQRQALLDESVALSQSFTEKQAASELAEKQRLTDEFADRAKALQQILNDPGATADQKAQATANLQAFAGLAGKQFDAATRADSGPLNHLAATDESITLTGVGAAAKERGDIEYAQKTTKATEEAVKLQADMAKSLAELLRLAQQNQNGGGAGPKVGLGI